MQSFDAVQSYLPDNNLPSSPPHHQPLPSFWTQNYSSPHRNSNQYTSFPSAEDIGGVDIVIIGSGITGVSTAAQLVEGLLKEKKLEVGEKKSKIIILEAREFCSGATGRNGGHLSPSPVYQFEAISSAHSTSDAIAAIKLEARATNWILDLCTQLNWDREVDLTRNGTLHIFKNKAGESVVRKNLEAARASGIDVSFDFLSADQVLKGYGAEAYSGILIPGNNLYLLKLVSKIYSKALKDIEEAGEDAGVELELWTSITVDRITQSKSKDRKNWTINTARGSIESNYVIHCTNAYASYLLPSLATGSSRIIPTRGQVLSILPSPTSDPKWKTGFSANDGFEYYFQRSTPSSTGNGDEKGGEIILGGGRSNAPPNFEFGFTNDGEVSTVVGNALREYVVDQFPGLSLEEGGMKVDMEWTGIMGFSESGAPIVGPVYVEGKKLQGQFISAGYTGHGMSRAPACAEAISMMVLAKLMRESYVKPDWLPNYYTTESYERKLNEKRIQEDEEGASCCRVV